MKLCLVILLVATALAVPVPNTDDTRLPTCTENRFTEGKRYLYSYESESVTGIVGTSDQLSGLKIDCTVQIQVPEQCELILTLQQCTLKELDPDVTSLQWSVMQEKSSAFNDEMVKYPLHFSMDSGKITSLEANQAEPLHILNVKKGILSTFQLEHVDSTKSITLIEESVFGSCSVDVSPHFSESKDRIDYIVTEKDLTKCDRPSRNVPVPTLVEIITNMTLADKLFTSSQFCKHDINKRDQVDLIKCDERHVFRPMSYMEAGLQSNISQVLVLQDVTKENSKPKFDSRDSRPTNLVYEFEDEKVPGVTTADAATEKLMALVDSTLDEVKMDTPRRFTEFVATIRSLSNETIHEFYPMAYNCSEYRPECVENRWREKLARQYVYDALSHCVTQPCFSLINTMIARNEINSVMTHTMLYTMAMQPYPTEVLIHETLRIAKALRSQSSILTLSTMVHNYWVNTQEVRDERDLPTPLYETMAFLKDIINYDCTAQSNELDTAVSIESNRQILLALKAIGNIGEPVQTYDNAIFGDNDKIISTLFRCAKNPAAPRNISLAAVQAFRRFNIRTARLTPLKQILLDTSMDVEVRIATYLMIMRSSPAKRDLKEIIDSMRTEPVDQIRAFIGSHIQNVLETEEPTLQSLREKLFKILTDDPMPEYPRNILKYSRNIEFSKAFRLPYINKTSSSQFETNIIYNSNGFLPRAAMFNTTLNVLGRSLYMVEFGIDMQGYEQTLEAMFGPQGYFPDVVMRTMYAKSKDLMRFLNETYQKKSVEYNLPQKMEQLTEKADQVMAMAQPYLDMASPYVQKAMKEGKPILDKAGQMVKPIIKPIMKKMKNQLSNLAEALPETLEPTETSEQLVPNHIMEELEKMHSKVSHLPEPKYIAVYLRAFENELGFTTLEEMLAMIPRFNVSNIKKINMQMVADLMNEISQKLADGVELNMTKSIILVQREWVIPTSIGMPLNVSLNGTSSMALRSLFRMKVDDIKKPMFVEGKFAPSVAVEVAGKMGVTLPLYGETGVLANATVYHSSSIAGNVTYKKGRLQFNLKNIQEPMNLFNFSTNLYLVRPDEVMEYMPGVEQDRSEYKFCSDVSRLVADDLCVSFAYPNASYAYAARFPLTGPMSFNVTLVPTDSVEAFTMEASLRREKTPTAKKSFSSIGKAAMKPKLLRDIVHFNFSAPGKELTRNISSLLVVDYQKTELQWNFTIPEVKAFRIYAGLLNLEDSQKNRIGYHLTYNISAAEIYNASTSLTVMSESDDVNTNCSVTLSSSVMQWRHTIAAQYLNTSGNWIASLNDTYYWDDETPLYKQILWPINNYTINQDKFRTSYILVKSNERECLEEVECDRRERVFETSLFRQNFTLNNTHTIKPLSTVSTLNVTFGNDYVVYPIVNFTAQKLDKSEMDVEKYEVTLNASRHQRYVAVIQDITRIRGEYNHSIRFVYYSVAKVPMPQFDELLGFPGVFDYYGDTLYRMVPSFMNTTIDITLRNETATMEDEIKPLRLLSHVRVTYPNPLNLHEPQTVSFVAKIANDSIYEDNEHSYWGHFNMSVPHLQFNTSYQAAVVKGPDGVTVGHNFTLVDQKRVQNWGFDTVANWMPLSSNLTWNAKVATPVLNITYDHVQFKNDGGFQLIFNDTVNNTLTNYLNHTVFGHFELKPEYISLNASLWTKMIQIDGNHIMRKEGPIVDLSWKAVQVRAQSMYKKVRAWDYKGLYNETKDVSKKMIDSSFSLMNSINVSTPIVGNMTLDHNMGFGIYGLNDTFKVNLTHEKYGLGANLLTNFGLNQTCFHTVAVVESKTPLHLMQGNGSFVLFKSAPMEVGVKSSSHMAIKTSKATASLNGTFVVDSMSNPWSFKSVNGDLKYDINSPIIDAKLNSFADLKNFVSPSQFEKAEGALTHTINSPLGKLTCNVSALFDSFRSMFNFNKIAGEMVHTMESKLANGSSVSSINLDNFSTWSKFGEVNATTVNQLISKRTNLSSDAEIVLRNFVSAFNFELVKATMNHDMATCIGNLTSNSQAVLASSIDALSLREANATSVNVLSTKWVNATSDVGLTMQDVTSIFNFRLLSGKMNHEVVSKVANLTSISQVAVDDSTNMWQFRQINATASNKIVAPLVDVSSDMDLLMNDFTSMTSFSLVEGNMKHLVKSYIGKLDSDSTLCMSKFINPFSFEHVFATSKNNFSSRMTNMTSDSSFLMKNFRSAANFDLISGNMTNVLNTGYINGSSNSSVVLSNFQSLLVFEEVNATSSNNLVSKLLNVDSNMLIAFQNFSSLFNFGKVNSSMVHKVVSRWVNATSASVMIMDNFTSPVSFTEVNFTSRNNMTSKIANLISEADVHFQEFTSILNFRKMAGSMKNLASSKWINVNSESAVLVSNHDCLFKFEEYNATTKHIVRSSLTNVTSDVVLRLQNFRSIFNFDKIEGAMVNNFTSKWLNATSNNSGIINNHKKLFKFEEMNATTSTVVDSPLVNVASDVVLRLQNFRSFFNFAKIEGTMQQNLRSKWCNATSRSSAMVNNHERLFRFDEMNATTTNIVDSQLVNVASDVVVRLQSFRSIFNFAKIEGTMQHIISSKWLNATSNSSGIVNNHEKLFRFEEINATTSNIMDSPWTNVASDVVLRLQNFRSIFNFAKIEGTMQHNLRSKWLNATSNSSGMVNNHESLFRFEEINATTSNIMDSPWTNVASDVVLRLQNFRSIFNFDKVNGTMVHTFTSKWLNATSNSSGIIKNHEKLFRFEEIHGRTSNYVNSRCGILESDVVLRMQDFSSIFQFNKVNGTAVHKLDCTMVNATSNSNLILHNFRSLFNFSEANTTSWNSVNSSLVNLTSEMALKLKNFRSIFNFDIISGLSQQNLNSRFVNVSTNNLMTVNNHQALFKFEEINATSDNKVKVLSTDLGTAALLRLENFRSILSFDRSTVTGNSTLASKILNATSSNTFVVNQHRALFNFDDISAITDSKATVLSTNLASRMFLGLDQFRSMFNFDKIAGGNNFNIESRMINGSSDSSMMVLNHPALFSFDEANATLSNELNVFNIIRWNSDNSMKMQKSSAFLKFKKLDAATNHGIKSKLVTITSNSSMSIVEHKRLFEFDATTVGTLNKLRSSLMNITSETTMLLNEFEKVFTFRKVNGTMRHSLVTPFLTTSSESAIILNKFRSLFNFPEAEATTSNIISSRLANITTSAGWRRIDSESLFKFNKMNTTMIMKVSLPVFVVSTDATTDFVNFRSITNFDRVNAASNIIWDECSFMNSTGRAEFVLDDFRSLFEFTEANASVSYDTTTKFGQFSSLTRGSLREFRSPFNFDGVCMDTKNNLTTPLAAFNQEAGLTLAKSTEFLKFERLNTTSMFNLSSNLISLTGLETFAVQDMSGLFKFSGIALNRQYNVKSWPANINLKDGIEMDNFSSLFNFNSVNTNMDYRIATPVANATWVSAVELKDFTSPLTFNLINANATVDLSSEIARIEHFSGLAFHDFAGSLLKFRLINGTMRNQIKSQLANLTTKSDIALKNFNSLFNFDNVNTRMSYQLITPVVESTLETALDLLNFRSWREFEHIQSGHNFTVVTKMVNVTTNSNIRMTKWTVYQQRMSANISSPVAEIDLLQTSDNQSVHLKVASPKHGSLNFLGKISDDGKLMNMTLYHMTTVDKLNVTDLQWLLMLNKSNVIYSNFSWNPAMIDGAVKLTNDLVATTINITMTAVKQTKNYTRHLVDVSRTYMNDQITKLNDTYQNIDVIAAEILANVREEVNKTLLKTKEYAIQQWRNAKEYDYDALWEKTVKEYQQLKEDLKEKYAELKLQICDLIKSTKTQMKEKYEELKVKALEKYDELKIKFDELIVKIEEIIKNKDHPINMLPIWYFNKSIYEILEISKQTVEKIKEKLVLKLTKMQEELNVVLTKVQEKLKVVVTKVQEKLKVVVKKIKDLSITLKTKAEEMAELYMAKYELKKAELKLVYTELKRMYDENDREGFKLFVRELIDDLSLQITELSEKVLEKAKVAVEEGKKMLAVVVEKTKNVTDKALAKAKKLADKALEKATKKLDEIIDRIIVMSKDRTNAVNKLTIRFLDRTVYEIAQEIRQFYEDQYVALLVKIEIYKEKFEIFMLKCVEESIRISLDEHNLINKYAIKYMGRNINEIVKEAIEKLVKLVEEITLKSENMYVEAKVKYADAKVKFDDYKEQAVQMYNDFDREVFAQQVRVFINEFPDKARNLSTEVVEKVKVAIQEALKKLEIAIEDAKVKLEVAIKDGKVKLDAFIEEAKVKLEEVIEQIVEMSKNESNAVNKFTLKYLNRTVYEIVEELVALSKEKYAEALVKLDIYKEKTVELLDKFVEEAIAISLNEANVINKYALKYTGRNVNELVKESIKNLTRLIEQVRERAIEMYDDAKVKIVENKERAIEMYGVYSVKAVEMYENYSVKAVEMYKLYSVKAVEMYKLYSVKAVEMYKEYSVKAVEKFKELRVRLLELYEAFKVQVREYYDYADTQVTELKEKLSALKEKLQNQPLNTSVRETMEYAEEIAEILKIKVDNLTSDLIQFYEENLTEENIMKLRDDAKKYIEDKVQPIIEKLEEINEERIQPLIRRLEEINEEKVQPMIRRLGEIGEDVQEKAMEALENNRVLELTRKFAEKTREYLVATRALNMKAIESAQEVIRMTREFVEACIEYLNNTMPGWIYRYYEIDQIPSRVLASAIEAAQMKMEQIPILIRLTPELTLNLTRFAIDYSLNTSRSAVSYSLNSIGQVGEHSFAMNISHPLNYTSFYRPPTLTNKQWEMVDMLRNKTEEAINQVVKYYNETRRYINETYPIVVEWIQQQEPIIREKYEEIRQQVEMLRDQAVVKYDEWKEKAEIKYDELRVKVDEMIEEAKVKYEEIREKAEVKYGELKVKAEQKYKEWKAKAEVKYGELKVKVEEKYNELKKKAKEYYPIVIEECKKAYALFRQELPNWRTHMKTAYNLTIEEIKVLQEIIVEKCIQLKEEAITTYEELQGKYYELKPRVEAKINAALEVVKTKLEKMNLKLKAEYKKLIALIRKEFPNWKEHINNLTNKIYLKFDEMVVKALELIEKIKEKMPEIYAKWDEWVARIKEITPDYIKENLPEMIEYIKETIKYLEGMIRNIEYPQLPQLPRLPTIRDIIPPFQSTGLIFGPLHVYTFDQKRYEFPGYKTEGCTYVLASDFVDRNFTILSSKDTVTLLLQEMSIKVNGENKVQINGREDIQELPYQSSGKEVKIVRNGQWVQISTTYGLDIKCDASYKMCLFNASRWYYNKTLGLLGTLNEEKHFDMRKPDGSVARDLTDFANSFEISGSKSCKIVPGRDEIFSQGPRDCSAEPSRKCRFLFSDPASPLADCFGKIDVTEFRSLCEEETRCYPGVEEAICNATTSYVEMCRSHGRQIEHVQECNKCGDEVIGEIWETRSTRSADIVLIVSENVAMARDHSIQQELTRIVEMTDKTLMKASITDNRYSLIAFGGAGIHKGAHQHTTNGKVFASSSEFVSGAESLEFYGDYETDSMDALRLATELELREEATKIFILVVEKETDAEIEEQLAIQALLEKNSITLNVISSYKTLKQEKSSKNIVGINWDGKVIMTSKSEKKDITTKLDMPRGSYSKLAKASRGAVFSLDQLQRQVDDVIIHCSKRIRNQVERPLEDDFNMKECVCERNIYGRAVSKCQIIAE